MSCSELECVLLLCSHGTYITTHTHTHTHTHNSRTVPGVWCVHVPVLLCHDGGYDILQCSGRQPLTTHC